MMGEAQETIRVLLVEDHTLVRAGIRELLRNLDGIEVVAEASNGREALDLIEKHMPNVVLMDIAMRGMNGLEVAERVIKQYPRVHVVLLSQYTDEEYVRQSLQIGANGYIPKDAATSELEIAIRAAAQGETYLNPSISKHLIENYLRRPESATGPLKQLTPRQREVLQLIAEGNTMNRIAKVLNISVKTVETHRAQLMERLDIHDVAGLVRYAVRIGLVTSDN
jgi:DNA-binding NarL/FixJ family response regulator